MMNLMFGDYAEEDVLIEESILKPFDVLYRSGEKIICNRLRPITFYTYPV